MLKGYKLKCSSGATGLRIWCRDSKSWQKGSKPKASSLILKISMINLSQLFGYAGFIL